MTLPIRAKLTIWYTTLLAASLITFSSILYVVLSKNILNSSDARLYSMADMVSRAVFMPGTVNLPQNFDVFLENFFGIKTSNHFIQLMNRYGKIAFISSTLGKNRIPLTDQAYHHALVGTTTYETKEDIAPYKVRVITYPLMEKGQLIGILQVGESLQESDVVLNRLFFMLVLGIPISIIMASGVGLFLSKKALKPVDDITSMAKKIEAGNLNERLKLRGPRDEIGRLTETFNDMIARLERSFKQVRQFTADASHELKTPLTVLKGEMEIALKTEKTVAGLREAISSSLEEIDKMSAIVRSLLNLAKLDSRVDLPKDDVRLDDILVDRFNQTLPLAKDKGINMVIGKKEQITIIGDKVRIGQLLFNLIHNAIKYTSKDGRIEISLEEVNKWAIIKIVDTGIGISAEDLPHIFDRFYRVDKARTTGAGGMGLGLSICKEIAEAHQGKIEVESEAGKGSVFMVCLPVKNRTNDILHELAKH